MSLPVNARRINRAKSPSIPVVIRVQLQPSNIELWRGDHFITRTTDPITKEDIEQVYWVLDFGFEEQNRPAHRNEAGRPELVFNDDGSPKIEWRQTGRIMVELQRVTRDGEGLSKPTTKPIIPVAEGDYDTGWF